MTIQPLIFDRKREKEHDKAMKLAAKALRGDFRLPKAGPMTEKERKELRALRARERRAAEAVQRALL